MENKVIITCAVTGSIHTPTMSPHLPYRPEDIVDFNFLANTHDKVVYGPGGRLFVIPPDFFKQIVPTDHLIFELVQVGKNFELLMRKFNFCVSLQRTKGIEVNLKLPNSSSNFLIVAAS